MGGSGFILRRMNSFRINRFRSCPLSIRPFRFAVSGLILVLSVAVYAQTEKSEQLLLENFKVYRDVVYAAPAGTNLMLNLFVPAKGDGPFPVIVWIHGGGWKNGSRASCAPLKWNRSEYACVSIDYRLSGIAQFPAQIEDCKAAIRWLRANAKQYNLDPERIGVWGGSAGGHLVAMLGVTGDVKEFDAGENLDQSSKVQAVCDFFGPVDLLSWAKTTGFEATILKDFIGGLPLEVPEKLVRASPLAYVQKGTTYPPFLIVYGDKDIAVPPSQSQLFCDALIRVRADAELFLVPGAAHGGPVYYEGEPSAKVQAFFDRYLLPGALKTK
jgi:acetyl esterase/lipase